ncbi:MAG: sigma-54-dependent Fis family transcriptional regulator [Alphaproteobacteria bacterium]|nr:sigma-54-dependent Fis family transcriptional regulator [Alphaproteobacteria bacterium]MCB9794684.1 sigma-54-dependent Fis family transcriptional regulator [Alphaproteobacteria bacterium]
MRQGRVLLVDEDPSYADALRGALAAAGYSVRVAQTVEGGLLGLRAPEGPPELLIAARSLARPGGRGLMQDALGRDPDLPVLVLAAEDGVRAAQDAGAWDTWAARPSPETLVRRVQRALEHGRLARENRQLRARLGVADAPRQTLIIGDSGPIARLRTMIDRVGPTDLGVLITGESGTGKEVVARALHEASLRHDKPFVPVDCASIPPNLMESELFGHERGAFTGASGARKGLVEAAHTGTFFLDEIGELGLPVQTRLLRLLQERELRRVGGNRRIQVDIRVIAATNRPVEDMVGEGGFREDLFHRLNVVRLHLPPLRERPDDIPALLNHFVGRYAAEVGRPNLRIDAEVLEALKTWSWPGNVRELVNCARYVASLSPGPVVRRADLPQRIRAGLGTVPLATPPAPGAAAPSTPTASVRYDLPYKQAKRRWLEIFEVAYVSFLLREHEGNVTHAARAAGIDRKSIQRLMKRHDVEGDDADADELPTPGAAEVLSSPPEN